MPGAGLAPRWGSTPRHLRSGGVSSFSPRSWGSVYRPPPFSTSCRGAGETRPGEGSVQQRSPVQHPHRTRLLRGPPGIAAGLPPVLQAARAEGAARGRGAPGAGAVGGFPGFPGLGGSCCPSLGEQRVLVHPEGCGTRERAVLLGDPGHCTQSWVGWQGHRDHLAAPGADCEEASWGWRALREVKKPLRISVT